MPGSQVATGGVVAVRDATGLVEHHHPLRDGGQGGGQARLHQRVLAAAEQGAIDDPLDDGGRLRQARPRGHDLVREAPTGEEEALSQPLLSDQAERDDTGEHDHEHGQDRSHRRVLSSPERSAPAMARAASRAAPVCSGNQPVTMYCTRSPMFTAWSPMRS